MTKSPTLIGVNHLRIHAPDPLAVAGFYQQTLGLQLVGNSGPDAPTGASALLASRPTRSQHQLSIFAQPEKRHVAFTVASLADLRLWAEWIQAFGVPVRSLWNHGTSLALYVDDPEGNLLELSWETGVICSQYPPIAERHCCSHWASGEPPKTHQECENDRALSINPVSLIHSTLQSGTMRASLLSP